MSDLDLIKADPRELIDLIKSSYYNETGETLQIGSDEYVLSLGSRIKKRQLIKTMI